MPSLVLIKSPGAAAANEAFPLKGPSTVLGREEGCDIVVPNHAVSRRHAQITVKNRSQYYVEDLKSRNGTTVNNEPVLQPRLLRNDDRVKICDFLYRFHDENALAPLPVDFSSGVFAAPEEHAGTSESTIQHSLATRGADRQLDTQPSERLRALLDISIALSKANELSKLLEAIADATLHVFRQADRCFVILREAGDLLVPKVVRVRRAGSADDDQRFSRTIVRKALDTGEAYLSRDASSDSSLGAAMSVADFRIRSVMCVPLIKADGQAIGALQIDTQDRSKMFNNPDLELLAIVANLAAVAVEKAALQETSLAQQKQQSEIELAQAVQRGMLPQTEPVLEGWEFYHHYSAALTIGGDYYDYVPLPDGRLAVLLGDVAGKGVPASLLMVKLSAEARYCMMMQPDTALAVRQLNEQMIRGGIGDRFVTFAAIVIDPKRNVVTIVNAGHMIPLVYRSGNFTDSICDADTGIPLGIMSGYDYVSKECPLEPGDNLLLFTDGVTDAMDPAGIMFGMEGVRRALSGNALTRPATVGQRVIKSVKTHAAGRAQNDDIAFVCFGRLLDNLPPRANDTDSLLPLKKKDTP